ncbi:uncharacterized protein [Panulirus ornatus]|uniref:uncharacterized protein isoform X2 n=1 Tax=Panulirus ornatus TaxID=150431 RepID=UPI003A8B99E9
MGKCCSKPQEDYESKGETHEVLLEVDPGGGGDDDNMTGGTLVVRSPGRWGVTHRGAPTTKKPIIVSGPGIHSNKRTTITKGPGVETSAGGTVVKTFRFSSNGTATESVSYNAPTGSYNSRFTATNSKGYVCGAVRQTGSTNIFTTRNNFTNEGKKSYFGTTPSPLSQRMGKTKTETTTRTFTKDGKRYEETVEVVTKEDEHGNVKTTTTTTTRALDPFSTKEMAAAVKDAKAPSGRRKSSSSSDSSPDRSKTVKEKSKSATESGKTGLLSRIKASKSADGECSDDEEEFVKDVNKYVNDYRVKHGVAKLKLNKEMNKFAKEWAKKLAADDKMSHRPDSKYGENIFCLSSNTRNFKVNAEEVVGKWYSEMKEHKFGEEPKGTLLKTGHFTQMVWKDTKQMGVGKARSAAGTKVFVVANFDPQGNWIGQFADQVPPLGGFKKLPSSGKTSLLSSKSRKSSSSSDSEASSGEEDFADDCVKAHNDYRKKHGAPPLKLSKKLNKYAKEWAVTIAKKDVLQHRSNSEYGENLYCAWSSNPKHKIKAQEAVDSWYSEIKDFTFGREPSDLRAGHFSQVVWLDTKEIGVAQARSRSGKIFVVANYSPAGNYVGSFATKVPRPK